MKYDYGGKFKYGNFFELCTERKQALTMITLMSPVGTVLEESLRFAMNGLFELRVSSIIFYP